MRDDLPNGPGRAGKGEIRFPMGRAGKKEMSFPTTGPGRAIKKEDE